MTRRRGSTLLETMIAGAVLLLGMVGIVQLLISGMTQFGISSARATGQDMSSAGVAEAMSLHFDAVPAGVSDAGILFDGDNRRFGRTRTVTEIGDGGVRARQVVVETEWRDLIGPLSLLRTARSTVIISEFPDANF
ncbi:MAG: hypothetical protein Q8L14_12365 [Myxococcales bacterium]|nr:hypothetical protein [Myxococcales bacterium]